MSSEERPERAAATTERAAPAAAPPTAAPPTADPSAQLMALLAGKWVVAAIAAAAELGVADALAAGPKDTSTLAQRLGCEPDALGRLLRALAGEGLVSLRLDDRWAVTPLGAQLETGALRDLCRFVGSASQWSPWAALPHRIRTGEPAFEHTHGVDLYGYLAQHPAESALYDRAIDTFTAHTAKALAERCELSGVRHIVDIGGGRGALLAALLEAAPEARGTLFDLPHVIQAAANTLARSAVADRVQTRAGDFFLAVPGGADLYVLKHVVHNWPDAEAKTLLQRCREAMDPTGRLLIVEALVLPGNRRGLSRLLDLEMMVLTRGGRVRTKPELRRLLKSAGLKIQRSTPLTGATRLLEVVPIARSQDVPRQRH